MAQPRFLQYLCNVPAIFSEHAEIHRHVARCLANLALYGKHSCVLDGGIETNTVLSRGKQ